MASIKLQQFLKQAQKLYLDGKSISEEDLQLICRQSSHISFLDLGQNKIKTTAMIHFSNKKWNNLIFLRLPGNRIGAKGCKYLTQAKMEKLQQLELRKNKFGSEGLLHLSKGNWINLRRINVTNAKTRQKGLEWLVRGNWPKLQILGIGQYDEKRNTYNIQVMQMLSLILNKFEVIEELFIQRQNKYSNKQAIRRYFTAKFNGEKIV